MNARLAKGMRTAGLILLLAGHICVHATDRPVERIDREWRERFVMGYFADIFRNRGQAQKKALAEFEATRQSPDTRARLRAAARHFMAMEDDADNCQVLDESLSEARAAGQAYPSELFDVAVAAMISASGKPCRGLLSQAEIETLARGLGDPARQYFVLEARVQTALRANRFNELIELAARQLDYAITDSQRAYSLLARAQAELNANPEINHADGLLQAALKLTDTQAFEALHLHVLGMLHRAAASAHQTAAARQYMQRALPGMLNAVPGERDSAFYLMLFARHYARHGEPQRALELLARSRAFGMNSKQVSMSRSRTLLETYAALGTHNAYDSGVQVVRHMESLLEDTAYFGPQSAKGARQAISTFFEKFGRYEAALAALKDANRASDAQQKVANEKARIELQEKLNVAAKDKENAELKSLAELQEARQRGWIIAFAVSACGVACAAGALTMAVRRGRRLAMVTADLKQRSAMLTAACHDLRQPVHALGMLTELGGDVQPSAPLFTDWLHSVRRSAASLAEMLDELMDLGRLDSGHYTPQLGDVSLPDVLHDVKLHFGNLARRKGLTLEVSPVQGHVLSDRALLRRILFNLVSNGIRYTDTGFVRVDAHLVANGLQLTVRDSGPGIPPEKLDDVFCDYVRLNPIKGGEGLGIGLPIVRRAAALLGHELTFASSPGEGTAVSLQLPFSEAGAPEIPAAAIDARPRSRSGHIALIEDDVDVRDAMAALLRSWGYTVRAASDAGSLLAESPAGPFTPDLLITDLHLVGSNGLDAIATVREALHAPDLPALLVTGDLDTALTAKAAIARAYLAHKPLAPSKLNALVKELMSAPSAAAPSPSLPPSAHTWREAFKKRKARH
ncbi:MAG: response regulator [Pelomonas sp.]|nr:response regulator [Roseateles sp.]